MIWIIRARGCAWGELQDGLHIPWHRNTNLGGKLAFELCLKGKGRLGDPAQLSTQRASVQQSMCLYIRLYMMCECRPIA